MANLVQIMVGNLQARRDRQAMPPPPPQPPAAAGVGIVAAAAAVAPAPIPAATVTQIVDTTLVESDSVETMEERERERHMARWEDSSPERQQQQRRQQPLEFGCFLCENGDPVKDADPESTAYGYKLIMDYITKHAVTSDLKSVCHEVVRLAELHIYKPAERALAREAEEMGLDEVPPLPYDRLTKEKVYVHLTQHILHPVLLKRFVVSSLQKLAVSLGGQVGVMGYPDLDVCREYRSTLKDLNNAIKDYSDLCGRNEEIQLDRRSIMNVVNTHRLEQLRARSQDTLGGATATGSSASQAAEAVYHTRLPLGEASLQRDDIPRTSPSTTTSTRRRRGGGGSPSSTAADADDDAMDIDAFLNRMEQEEMM